MSDEPVMSTTTKVVAAIVATAIVTAVLVMALIQSDRESNGVPEDGGTPGGGMEDVGAPEDVVEAVRAEHPNPRTDDIGYSYQDAKTQVPDATDDQIAEWIIEAQAWNEAVDEWNTCLESHDGYDRGCSDPEDVAAYSADNPLGW